MFVRLCSQNAADTHETKWFQTIWRQVAPHHQSIIVDPFARNCRIAHPFTNDINPETEAVWNLDALEFLQQIDTHSVDFVIFDPPFSERMADDHYDGIKNVFTVPGYVSKCFKEIYRILRAGGQVLKFGYNSNRDHSVLDLVCGWLIAGGGNRNDTIVTLWQKNQKMLDVFSGEQGQE